MPNVAARIERGTWRPSEGRLIVDIRPDGFVTPEERERERLLNEVRAEEAVQRRIEEACRKAFDEGYRKGLADGRADVAAERELLTGMFGEIEEGLEMVWNSARRELGELALAIARRVIGELAETKGELAKHLALELLGKLKDQARIAVVVNPDDAGALRAAEVDLYRVAEGVRSIEIVERDALPRGAVLLEGDYGAIHLRPLDQIEQVGRTMLGM
ncbi:MAG: hypothetical protein FJY67_00405 [Calditrichaeota bacterium]|nr:hypothetical protein [Calditrichota bacterium]